MSRASITTGGVLFDTTSDKSSKEAEKDGHAAPMHIAIIGDFSGRASRGKTDIQGLAKRKAVEIDRDNFDEVFARLNVELQLPFDDEPIRFNDIDELHPDHLLEHVALFEKFRTLKRRLKKPEHFQAAMEEIQALLPQQKTVESTAASSAEPAPTNILDTVLTQSNNRPQNTANNIDQLIHSIVAPYLEKKADPRLADMEAHVDNAAAESLRKVMHASEFQTLEANWRALYFLVRRLETSSKLKLFILDISRQEIQEDLANSETLEQTATYSLLVEKYRVQGATPFSILQFNYELNHARDDVRLASAMSMIAQENHAVALTGAHEKLAGCESLTGFDKTQEWNYPMDAEISDLWSNLRARPESKHLAMVAPKFLLRLPYGKKTSPIERFPFEELSEAAEHGYYLWGNSATLITLLLALSYGREGWSFTAGSINEVNDLPLHIYEDEDGDQVAKACAEIFISDNAVEKFAQAGILSVRSVRGSARIIVPNFRSFAQSGTKLFA